MSTTQLPLVLITLSVPDLQDPAETQMSFPNRRSRTCMIFRGHIQSSVLAVARRTQLSTTQIRSRLLSTRSALPHLTNHQNPCWVRLGSNRSSSSPQRHKVHLWYVTDLACLDKQKDQAWSLDDAPINISSGLNFFNPTNETLFNVGNGLDQCVLEASLAYKALGDFSMHSRLEMRSMVRIPTHTCAPSLLAPRKIANMCKAGLAVHADLPIGRSRSYVTQWNQYAEAISQNLTGADAMKLFQGCAFEAPRHVGNRTYWNVENAILDGMGPEKAKTVSDHDVS